MKRIALLVTLLVLTMVLVTGCSGVSQEDLDAAVKEADALKTQLSSVQADLTKSEADFATSQQNLTTVTADRDSVKSQLDKAKADLTTAQANLSKSSADLATAQQSFSTLNTSVKTYQVYVDIATAWFDYDRLAHMGVTWDTLLQTAIPKIQSAVYATQDSALINAWDTKSVVGEVQFYELFLKRLTELKPKTN